MPGKLRFVLRLKSSRPQEERRFLPRSAWWKVNRPQTWRMRNQSRKKCQGTSSCCGAPWFWWWFSRWWQLKHFLIFYDRSLPGEMIQFDERIFQDGLVKNHQLALIRRDQIKSATRWLSMINQYMGVASHPSFPGGIVVWGWDHPVVFIRIYSGQIIATSHDLTPNAGV